MGEDFRFKPTRWLDCAAGPVPAVLNESARSAGVNDALSKIRIASIAAAALLVSPAFAAGPLAQDASPEQIDSQRIIREIVIDGILIEAGSDEALTNELRLSWLDQSSALDRQHQHSW